jgi:hypothetical protein
MSCYVSVTLAVLNRGGHHSQEINVINLSFQVKLKLRRTGEATYRDVAFPSKPTPLHTLIKRLKEPSRNHSHLRNSRRLQTDCPQLRGGSRRHWVQPKRSEYSY